MLTCHPEDVQSDYLIRYPLLLVEVLSPSTAHLDREKKWNLYRRLPSLRYFLFVSQEEPFVEMYSRNQSDALFVYQAFDQLTDIIHLTDLHFSIRLEQIYENIRFENQQDK